MATVDGILDQDPNDSDAIRAKVVLLNQSGKPDQAIETLRATLKRDPNNPELVILLGNFLGQANRNDEAIKVFQDLIDKNLNNDEVLRFARSSLSTIYTNMGDYAKGEAELETLFARIPDDPTVNNDLGYLYAEQGKNLERAETMIRKALVEEPNNSAFLDSLGWVLFKRGKAEEARQPLEKALANTRSEDSTMHDHLGDVYFKLQELGRAKSSWERAVQLATQSKVPDKRLPEIRKKLESLPQVSPAPRPSGTNTP